MLDADKRRSSLLPKVAELLLTVAKHYTRIDTTKIANTCRNRIRKKSQKTKDTEKVNQFMYQNFAIL